MLDAIEIMDRQDIHMTTSKQKATKKQSVSGGTTKCVTYSVEEAAEIVGIGRSTAYSPGVLPTVRIGGRLLVPKAALEKLLQTG